MAHIVLSLSYVHWLHIVIHIGTYCFILKLCWLITYYDTYWYILEHIVLSLIYVVWLHIVIHIVHIVFILNVHCYVIDYILVHIGFILKLCRLITYCDTYWYILVHIVSSLSYVDWLHIVIHIVIHIGKYCFILKLCRLITYCDTYWYILEHIVLPLSYVDWLHIVIHICTYCFYP